jgi:hypothetical protein
MTESTFVKLKKWLRGKEIGPLWFAEAPYKVYMAKVTGEPVLNVIPFTINNERIYKGEGKVTFTALYPFARTPDYVEYKGIKLSGNYHGSYSRFSNYNEIKDVLPQQINAAGNATDNAFGELPFYITAKLLSPNDTLSMTIISDIAGDIYEISGAEYDAENGVYTIVSNNEEEE